MEDNATEELIDSVLENSEERTDLQSGKIYHATGEYKGNKQKILVIDWS